MSSRLLVLLALFAALAGRAAGASDGIELTRHELELVAGGEVILREATRKADQGKTWEAVGEIRAPLEAVHRVLVDFEAYPKFMPNVSKVEVLRAGDGEATVNFVLDLPLGKTKKYRVRLRSEKSAATGEIRWKMIEWPGLEKSETIDDTEGYWLLESRAEGKETLVLYHVYTDPGPVPLGLGWIVDIMSKNSLPQTVLKTRERVQEILEGRD